MFFCFWRMNEQYMNSTYWLEHCLRYFSRRLEDILCCFLAAIYQPFRIWYMSRTLIYMWLFIKELPSTPFAILSMFLYLYFDSRLANKLYFDLRLADKLVGKAFVCQDYSPPRLPAHLFQLITNSRLHKIFDLRQL